MELIEIRKIVADYYGVPWERLDERNREKEIRRPRQIAITFSRVFTDKADSEIGCQYGLKRSTVVQTFVKLLYEIKLYPSTRSEVINISIQLGVNGDYIVGLADHFYEVRNELQYLPKYMKALMQRYACDYVKTHSFNLKRPIYEGIKHQAAVCAPDFNG